jgi:nitric oxide reductase large subunit
MDLLIWIGAGVSLLGVVELVWCIVLAMRARQSGMEDDAMRAELQRVVVLNMAALGVSALGLMMVVAGIILS